jgi:hypothetical protein
VDASTVTTTLNPKHSWQIVIVIWGEKYSVTELNGLIASVMDQASSPPRVTLISDRPRVGVLKEVIVREMPPFFNQPQFLRGGCQAKLSVFEKDILPTDVPAILMDIDTLVMGDICKLISLLTTSQTVAILQSAVLPFGALARAAYKLTNKRKCARGNSSVVVFHPAHCHYISTTFQSLFTEHNGINFRPMIADDRFISWVAQPHMRAIPKADVVKFPTEFMWQARWFARLRGRMPWLKKRWSGLTAVTFPGLDMKGQDLAMLPENAEITDRKGRHLIWSHSVLGPVQQPIKDYYLALKQSEEQEETS